MKPNVWCITATCGRHTLLERLVATFLAQDYTGHHTLLIYNNSDVCQKLHGDANPQNVLKQTTFFGSKEEKRIVLINNHLDGITKEPYKNLGAIYRDALTYVPEDVDIITHMDDDDLFLPNHISEGAIGFKNAKSLSFNAYKPERSWFRHHQGLDLMGNNLEPSVFIDAAWLRVYGYSETTSDQHMQWFGPLLTHHKMLVDPKGKPTLIYNWGDTHPTFKTSGNAGDPRNFDNYRMFSQDHGDRIITPDSKQSLSQYYDAVKAATPNIVNG